MIGRIVKSIDYLQVVIDAIPSMVFIADRDARILDLNKAAAEALDIKENAIVRRLCGDILRCVNAGKGGENCGKTEACVDCVIRNSIRGAYDGQKIHRRKAKIEFFSAKYNEKAHVLVTASPFKHEDNNMVLLVLEDVTELMELKKIVPICSYCKQIRDDKGYWSQIEAYIEKHSDVDFSHSICPDCAKKYYPDMDLYDGEQSYE